MTREIEHFTDEEIMLFAEALKNANNGETYGICIRGDASQNCIAIALCMVGCRRRNAQCSRNINSACQTRNRYIQRRFSEEQRKLIIDFCLDDEISKTHASAYQYLGKGLYITLAALVPFYPTRDPERWREFLG